MKSTIGYLVYSYDESLSYLQLANNLHITLTNSKMNIKLCTAF